MSGAASSDDVLGTPSAATERVESSDTESSEAFARQPVGEEEEEEEEEEEGDEERLSPSMMSQQDDDGARGGESVKDGSELMQVYVEEACRKARELREKSESVPHHQTPVL